MTKGTRPTVLIVDDEPALADGHAERLDDYDVRTAYDGVSALEKMDDSVDVVLLDRMMPGLSGDEVLEHVRDRDVDCRVVMLTGVEPSVDDVGMSFDDYLTKPVTDRELRDAIDRVHRRSAYDAKLQQYFGLASKRAALEAEHVREELADEPKYRHLCERLDALQSELDAVLADLPPEEGYRVATDAGGASGGHRADDCYD